MTVIPNTEVRLLSSVPFNQSYEHTRKFNNVTEQTNYFLAKSQYTFLDFTYQREEQAIRVPRAYDDLYLCNYVMYKNTSFGSKWFYGFITHREYINPDFTKIYFELDVFQTWQFDITWNPSFVEREHANRWNTDGTPVINTVDEGLNYGTEYNIVSAENYRPCAGVYFMVVVAKQGMHSTLNKSYYASINGLPQLLVYYIHPFMLDGTVPNTNLGSLSGIGDFLGAMYTQDNAVNNIVSIYVTDALPNNPSYVNSTLSFDSGNYQKVPLTQPLNTVTVNTLFVTDMTYGTWTYVDGSKYTGYTNVTESKLLMYPYTLVELVDFKGNKAEYKNEYINHTDILLTISASLGVSNKIAYSIDNYLNGGILDGTVKNKISLEHSLINNEPNDMPIMTDLLSAYLQGNRNGLLNQKNSIAFNGAFGALGNTMTKNPMGVVGGVGNAVIEMQGINAKLKDIDNSPPQLTKMGSNSYFDYGNGLTGVWIIKKEITPEYRKKLTDFFKMCGYKINEVKLPNLHTRQHFNYVKTVGANIVGNIPNNDIAKIKGIFDKGITLWHVDSVTDYSLANGEI